MFILAMKIILFPPSNDSVTCKSYNIKDEVEKALKKDGQVKSKLLEICCKYADDLYSKRDYANSISQYIQTIGHISPSIVIKKFIDSQKMKFLTMYLEGKF
jgi:hypothetical protein